MRRVTGKSAETSDAAKVSPSPTPKSSGGPRRATTTVSGSRAVVS